VAGGKTASTVISKAWRAAVDTLGSWYHPKEKEGKEKSKKQVKEKRQTKLQEAFAKSPETLQLTKKNPPTNSTPTAGIVSPDPKKRPAQAPAEGSKPPKSSLKVSLPSARYARTVLSETGIREFRTNNRYKISKECDETADVTC
jgi:hypothetical protein